MDKDTLQNYSNGEVKQYSHNKLIKALEGIAEGLREYCTYNPLAYKAQAILARVAERLSQEKSKKSNETAPSFLKISELL